MKIFFSLNCKYKENWPKYVFNTSRRKMITELTFVKAEKDVLRNRFQNPLQDPRIMPRKRSTKSGAFPSVSKNFGSANLMAHKSTKRILAEIKSSLSLPLTLTLFQFLFEFYRRSSVNNNQSKNQKQHYFSASSSSLNYRSTNYL